MRPALLSWQFWAVLSAVFAALTAIFAKIGVENVNSDFATFIRTLVILVIVAAIVAATGQWQPLKLGDAARVAPIDKLSVVLVAVFGVFFLGERLSGPNWLGVMLIAAGAVLVAYRV
jgi:transporter family protein